MNPRPTGSGRPNRNRRLISLYLSVEGLQMVDAVATGCNVTRSDVIRLALKHGLKAAELELKQGGV